MENVRSVGEVNLAAMDAQMEKFCLNCDFRDTPDCREAACLTGFARKVLKFAASRGILDIPGAAKLLPDQDFKPYYPEMIAAGLAETCRQCRECRDNHSPDCVISLVRRSLENMILTENIDYPGSVFAYLAAVKEKNPDLAAMLAKQLKSR